VNTRYPLLAALLLGNPLTLPAAGPATPRFRAVDVDTQIQIGYGVTVADVNGDKKPDILLADKSQIVWYENPGWQKHVIAEKLTPQDNVCIAAADIDGDGKCEIAVGAGWNPSDTTNSGALFYLVPPADRTQKWTPVKFDLVSVPLHGRGNNPNTGEGAGVNVLALKMPANPRDPWTTKLLDSTLHKTHNFEPYAANAGPADELLIASKEGGFALIYEGPKPWKLQFAGSERGGAGEVRRGRLARYRDFFATIEPMHGANLVVYFGALKEPKPSDVGGDTLTNLYEPHVLDSSLMDGHALACGDLAGSGSDQIVVGWRAMNKPGVRVGIKLFTALDKEGDRWVSTLVDDNTMACEDLCLADLDGDGRLDIIAAGRATKNVKVYFNEPKLIFNDPKKR
jgi:hypothetical protein